MAVAIGALLGSAPGSPPIWADVVVEKPVHDYGTVEQGTQVRFGFVLQNRSRSMLRIDEVSSSCGCTAAVSEGTLLRPKQRTTVRVTLDTRELTGRSTKTVTLRTSDPRTPVVQMALTGIVVSDLVVTPTPVYFGSVYRGEPVRRELAVRPGRPGERRYTVSAVQSESPAVRAYLEAGAKPGEQKIVVELGYDPPEGRFNDELIIHTTSPRQPVIKVPVFGQVIG